jgi:hypothetical protein
MRIREMSWEEKRIIFQEVKVVYNSENKSIKQKSIVVRVRASPLSSRRGVGGEVIALSESSGLLNAKNISCSIKLPV